MDNIELILTDLGEEATKRLAMKYRPFGIKENMMVVRVAKEDLVSKLNEKIVTNNNKIGVIFVKESKK